MTPDFIDLEGYGWAELSINRLAGAGIIKGTSPRTFSPGADITRADFAILLVRAFQLRGSTSTPFADVPDSAYYTQELSVAKANGVVNGVGGNRFNPNGAITRQDVMVMLARALEKLEYPLADASGEVLRAFPDAAQVAGYARAAAASLVANGIVAGKNGKIDPASRTSRAEAAVMLDRILEQRD